MDDSEAVIYEINSNKCLKGILDKFKTQVEIHSTPSSPVSSQGYEDMEIGDTGVVGTGVEGMEFGGKKTKNRKQKGGSRRILVKALVTIGVLYGILNAFGYVNERILDSVYCFQYKALIESVKTFIDIQIRAILAYVTAAFYAQNFTNISVALLSLTGVQFMIRALPAFTTGGEYFWRVVDTITDAIIPPDGTTLTISQGDINRIIRESLVDMLKLKPGDAQNVLRAQPAPVDLSDVRAAASILASLSEADVQPQLGRITRGDGGIVSARNIDNNRSVGSSEPGFFGSIYPSGSGMGGRSRQSRRQRQSRRSRKGGKKGGRQRQSQRHRQTKRQRQSRRHRASKRS